MKHELGTGKLYLSLAKSWLKGKKSIFLVKKVFPNPVWCSVIMQPYLSFLMTCLLFRDGSGSDSGNGSGGSLMSVDLSKLSSSHSPPPTTTTSSGSNNVTYTTIVPASALANGVLLQSTTPFTSPSTSADSLSASVLESCSIARSRPKPRPVPPSSDPSSTGITLVPPPGPSPGSYERQLSAPPQLDHQPTSVSSENVYEHLFIPENSLLNTTVVRASSVRNGTRRGNETSGSGHENGSNDPPPLIPRRNPQARRLQK
jgi:hypothetical protein